MPFRVTEARDGSPLVTVTGLPGVGKTAVSLAAARAAAPGFADGSLLLRLDTLRDEALLPHTIAAGAGCIEFGHCYPPGQGRTRTRA